MTDILVIIIGIAVLLALVVVIALLLRRNKPDTSTQDYLKQDMVELAHSVERLGDKMTDSLTKNHDSAQRQFATSSKLIADITEKLTKLDDTNKSVLTATDKLEDLQNILLNPKHRGNFGEFQLNSVLDNFFPPNQWQAQYKFKDGAIVDAALFLRDDKILPIDSKFSLENYNRMVSEKDATKKAKYVAEVKKDLKGRIDETAKYVRPTEGTMDFAFMFIPSEALYYDMLIAKVGESDVNSRDLIEYAFKQKRVIIVSPTTFVAYLQTVLQGLRSLQIEEQAKDIQKHVMKLGQHLNKFDDYMGRLGNSLGTTVNHYNNAHKELKKVDKDVIRIAGGDENIEQLSIDGPTDSD